MQEETRNVARAVARVAAGAAQGRARRRSRRCRDRVRNRLQRALAGRRVILRCCTPAKCRSETPLKNPLLRKILAAAGLTRRGELIEATTAIQRALSAVASTQRLRHARAGPRRRLPKASRPRTCRACSTASSARSSRTCAPPTTAARKRASPSRRSSAARTGRVRREQLHRRSRNAQLQAVRAGRLRRPAPAAGRHAPRLHPGPGRLRRRHAHERAGPGAGLLRPLPGAGAALERAQVLELVHSRTTSGAARASRRCSPG